MQSGRLIAIESAEEGAFEFKDKNLFDGETFTVEDIL
jgi:hypothetical protein